MAIAGGALGGRLVVVTRPIEQAQTLVDSIAAAGGRSLLLPALAIEPAADSDALAALAGRLGDYDFACFVSQNAVRFGCEALARCRPWPAGLRAMAMGPASARLLADWGFAEVIVPAGPFDSETLLQHPGLESERVAGRRVVILRGDGGREVLGQGLAARGARVEYVQCYRRRLADFDFAPLAAALAAGALSAITVTSSESLVHLSGALRAAGVDAFGVPLFVPHERIAGFAKNFGWQSVVLTAAGDAGLVAGMEQYFASKT